LYQDAVFDQIDYDSVRTLTKSVMVTIGIVVSTVDWTNYTTSELTQLTTQIFQIYSNYSLFLNRKFIDQNHDGMQVYSPNVRLGAKTFRLGIDNHVVFQFEDIKLQVPLKAVIGESELQSISATAVVTHWTSSVLSSDNFTVNSPIIS